VHFATFTAQGAEQVYINGWKVQTTGSKFGYQMVVGPNWAVVGIDKDIIAKAIDIGGLRARRTH
jgi:hypothetical protein